MKTHWIDAIFNSSMRDTFLGKSVISEIETIWSNQVNQHSNFFFTTLALINDISFSGNSGSQRSLIYSYIFRFCDDTDDYERLKKLAEELYINNEHLIERDVFFNS